MIRSMATKANSFVKQPPVTLIPRSNGMVQVIIYTNEVPVYHLDKDGVPTEEIKSYTYDFNMFYCPASAIDTADVEANPGNYLNHITYDKSLQNKLAAAVQQHMDVTVQERNYDNIQSVCTYATSTNEKFRAEAEACIAWRDAVWTYCYQVIDDCIAGRRSVPTGEALVKELPVLEW